MSQEYGSLPNDIPALAASLTHMQVRPRQPHTNAGTLVTSNTDAPFATRQKRECLCSRVTVRCYCDRAGGQ